MENDLKKVQNIGKETARKLNEVGIDSFETLVHIGTENVFKKLQSKNPNSCINLLYSIEGAIEGIKWNEISKERKLELIAFFNNNRLQ
ncbi:MAG: TfoX/Sxy family protein [Bacteroidales bacterium]|nr:TfoX/Sxy family protein [Bacteroidales bacterium]